MRTSRKFIPSMDSLEGKVCLDATMVPPNPPPPLPPVYPPIILLPPPLDPVKPGIIDPPPTTPGV